ncbi:ATP-binding protein [Nitrospirillum sp. BR 11164]|uniref:ATP-binding protein n=1 Tax=Nitrospirillum sp. BR 11164 TaxID=3104324 RepID=UPI002AFEC00F|nr:ATP-binding protein [Nitrospirillum sp. BR 11164]MEA1650956.1 ATP-binding protein [Nitrospirillum sp. BR 11164]
MKEPAGTLDAMPSKRLFLSIIADYDLNKSICELVDNGLDVWVRGGRRSAINICIDVDVDQKTINVKDDAGGLPRTELRYIVGPGQTGSSANDETIGIFGVGTKRAVVALAQDIKIITRFKKEKTYQIEFDDSWLSTESWELEVYQVADISPGSTIVELSKLRIQLDNLKLEKLKTHLQATYAKFIKNNNVNIILNGEAIEPIFFDNWSFPPNYEPRHYHGDLFTSDKRKIRVNAIAGLSNESSPGPGEYGVYFYCNDRLIARALKTFEVGFMKGYAGLPHPKISLTKVIVSLNGDARSMPWNSSKSDISTKHEVFQALHDWLNQVVKDYAALSRIWMGDWPDKVFQYNEGGIINVPVDNFPTARKSYLPPAPKSKPRYAEIVAESNVKVAKQKPWARGLYEGIIAADLISKQRQLEQKNKISLIVLDSTLKIAFKEFLVNESGVHYSDQKLLDIFSSRHKVHLEVQKYVAMSQSEWQKIKYFSDMRNSLIHRRVSGAVSDSDLDDFRSIVEDVLKKLYKLKF